MKAKKKPLKKKKTVGKINVLTTRELQKLTKELKPVKKVTKLGKSYWHSKGAYQKELDKFEDTLIPAMGEAKTVHGEMLRSISQLYYDFCNNGNINVIDVESKQEAVSVTCTECYGSGEVDADTDEDGEEFADEDDHTKECPTCNGSGEEEEYEDVDGDITIDERYQKMLDFLEKHLGKTESLNNLNEFLMNDSKGYSTYTFDKDEMKVYDAVMDDVIYHILTTKNTDR